MSISHSQGASGNVRSFDFGYFGSARRLLIDNVLKRVTNSQVRLGQDDHHLSSLGLQAAVLRRRAVHQLTSQGNSAPFLALVGVSLASGSGIITKEDEIESICYEIRQTVGKTRLLQSEEEVVEAQNRDHLWCLKDFELGRYS